MDLIFATHNNNKCREINEILGSAYTIKSLKDIQIFDEIEENGTSFRENALIKAQYVFQKTGLNCFADDSGLVVDALNGEPGIYSARYADSQGDGANINKVLTKLTALNQPFPFKAHFQCVVALILNGEIHFFEGTVHGYIINEKRGENGFGYDPIFVPEGYDKTFAELPSEVKNNISHRFRAIEQMSKFLSNR